MRTHFGHIDKFSISTEIDGDFDDDILDRVLNLNQDSFKKIQTNTIAYLNDLKYWISCNSEKRIIKSLRLWRSLESTIIHHLIYYVHTINKKRKHSVCSQEDNSLIQPKPFLVPHPARYACWLPDFLARLELGVIYSPSAAVMAAASPLPGAAAAPESPLSGNCFRASRSEVLMGL